MNVLFLEIDMKPVFATDITTDKDNSYFNAEEFIKERTSQTLSDKLDSCGKDAESSLEAAELPPVLRFVRGLCGSAGGVCILSFLMAFSELGFVKAYEKAPAAFYIGIFGIAVFVLLSVLAVRRSARILSDAEAERLIGGAEAVMEKIYNSLGVPKDAPDVDVLFFRYKMKDGEPVPVQQVLEASAYLNLEFRIFEREGSLFFADMEALYELPLGEGFTVRKINKKFTIPHWNKKTPYTAEIYREFNVKKGALDCFSFNGCYVLEIKHGDETLAVYFPSYELPVLKKILNSTFSE